MAGIVPRGRAASIAALRGEADDATSVPARHSSTRGGPLLFIVLTVLVVVTATVCVSVGSVSVEPHTVWRIVAHRLFPPGLIEPTWTAVLDRIIADVRLPRVLLALVCGMSLTLVGFIVQAVLRNPLAGPTILGVSSGAATGAVLVMRFGIAAAGAFTLQLAAFGGALAVMFLVLAIARVRGRLSATSLVLTGMAISAVLSAVTSLIVLTSGDPQLASQVLFWTLGGFGAGRWNLLLVPAAVLLVCVVIGLLRARDLNLLLLGEQSATSMGLNVDRFRRSMFVLSAAVVGVTVAVCGVIGFVGLVMPHVTRLLVGSDHRRALPAGLLLGASFTMLADLLARTIISPSELPVGIITAVIGGPFFLYLLRRSNKKAAL